MADVEHLARDLRALYASPGGPGERWGHRARVRLADGTEVDREAGYRDDPMFPAAAARLMESGAGDDAPLGAWLLGTLPASRHREAEALLTGALAHHDTRVAFEAARALAVVGGRSSLGVLEKAIAIDTRGSAGSPSDDVDRLAVKAAAAWARDRVKDRAGDRRPAAPAPTRLCLDFQRGVCWWFEGEEADHGASSFRTLASLGVTWISVHTWDPRQRSVHDPEWSTSSGGWALRDLSELVRNAHAAGLALMVKPHLEMGHRRPTPAELAVLRGRDEAARQTLIQAYHAERQAQGWHNEIAMSNEEDWRTWFHNYESYLLDYARRAQAAGADMLCVGRELDRTVLLRERDWRVLIARIREVFHGKLLYSANFDTYAGIRFWDALDFIGVSAYFPLSPRESPTLEELAAGWDRALAPLEALSRQFDRPVLLAEVGYPAVPGSAATPWREQRAGADVWLQARCYEAALRAVAARPWIQGTYWWLWEGVWQPPFRDPSFTVQGKPASFVMSSWYR